MNSLSGILRVFFVIYCLFLPGIFQKTFGLSAVKCLLYPSVSIGSVTVLAHSSYVSQKMVILCVVVCHGFLDAATVYVKFDKLNFESC